MARKLKSYKIYINGKLMGGATGYSKESVLRTAIKQRGKGVKIKIGKRI